MAGQQTDAGAVAEGQPGDRLAAPAEALCLTEDADWEQIAARIGGRLRNREIADSGDYETIIEIPVSTDPETSLADADNAIGQVIRKAESVLLEEGQPDAKDFARALLAICAPWTGGLRIDEGARAGVAMIAAERLRQVAVEGYTPEHDAEHVAGTLATAGAAYAAWAAGDPAIAYDLWPGSFGALKPGDGPLDSLVKAGALIAAEIDRIVALKAQEGTNEEGGAR